MQEYTDGVAGIFLHDFYVLIILFVVTAFLLIMLYILFHPNRNDSQPILWDSAVVKEKHTQLENSPSFTCHNVTFELKNGNLKEFQVNLSNFDMLTKGDCGRLNFQGTRFLGFEREQ